MLRHVTWEEDSTKLIYPFLSLSAGRSRAILIPKESCKAKTQINHEGARFAHQLSSGNGRQPLGRVDVDQHVVHGHVSGLVDFLRAARRAMFVGRAVLRQSKVPLAPRVLGQLHGGGVIARLHDEVFLLVPPLPSREDMHLDARTKALGGLKLE